MADVASRLPDISTLLGRCRALAMLDAIVCPQWEYRSYSFNRRWADGQQMASMRTGSGDDYSIVFTPQGVFIRGFDHESSTSPWRTDPRSLWPGLLDGLPEVLLPQVHEPAFCYEGLLQATFCLWRLHGDGAWHTGSIDYADADPVDADPDGAEWLLGILTDDTPQSYLLYAEEVFEIELESAPVEHVLAGRPLSDEVFRAINPDTSLDELSTDIDEIGYPAPDAR